MSKPMTAEEQAHVSKVLSLGCVVCWYDLGLISPAVAHHPRFPVGMGQRADHKMVIPLCPLHHTDGGHSLALHAGQKTWENKFGTERELLAKVEWALENGHYETGV